MKILYVISDLRPSSGGPPKAALEMSAAVVKAGHEVSIYTTDLTDAGEKQHPESEMVDGVTIHYFKFTALRTYPFSFSLAAAIKRNVHQFDLVHIHGIYNYHVWHTANVCRKQNVPYIIRPYGSLDPYLMKKSRFRKLVFHRLLLDSVMNDAAAIHYTAEDEMKLAHEPLEYSSPAIIIPLGINLTEYANLPDRDSFRSLHPQIGDDPVVLFLGRINFKKGLDLLAVAFGKVLQEIPDAWLVIAGPEDIGFGEKVRTWLRENHCLDRTIFTGMLLDQQKFSALVDADLFVLPSYTENFGITLAEAMACGLPVITTDKVNIWREIQQANAGKIIHTDAEELAEAIKDILSNSNQRKEYGKNGQKLVEEQFNWEKVAQLLLLHYRQAIQYYQSKSE